MGNNKERTAWFPPFTDGVGSRPQEIATDNQSIQSTEGCLKQGMKCTRNRHL